MDAVLGLDPVGKLGLQASDFKVFHLALFVRLLKHTTASRLGWFRFARSFFNN